MTTVTFDVRRLQVISLTCVVRIGFDGLIDQPRSRTGIWQSWAARSFVVTVSLGSCPAETAVARGPARALRSGVDAGAQVSEQTRFGLDAVERAIAPATANPPRRRSGTSAT
jgi:hypothetical protein